MKNRVRSRNKPKRFNLIVAGHARSGKTDFLATLFETLIVDKLVPTNAELKEDAQILPSVKNYPVQSNFLIEFQNDENEKIHLNLIDSPSLDVPVLIEKAEGPIKVLLESRAVKYGELMQKFISDQFSLTMTEEHKVKRDPNPPDYQVHCMLYFLNPEIILNSNGLTFMDKVVLEKLCPVVNILPVLGKSDMITMQDLKRIRANLQRDFKQYKFYEFQDDSDDSKEVYDQMLPFCIISSEELSNIDDNRVMGVMHESKKLLAREYLWGFINIQNRSSCDFELLKELLLVDNLDDMRSYTRNYLYESWRTEMLASHKKSLLMLPGDLKIKMVLNGMNEVREE